MSSAVGGQQTYLSRFELVSSHFLKMLESKSRDFAFAVLLFDDRITSWRSGELVQNTDSARRELKDFLRRNGPNGGTDLVLATRSVVQVKGAQECFLLTDGESGGEREAVALALESQQRGVPVHCIGVDLNHRGEQLLKNIAAAGGGECSLVDAKKIAKEGEAPAA
jgi:Mg-chelatase subunit ChlD